MKFPHKLEPDANLNLLRFGSEEGKWEMGIRRMMFGFRVSLNKVGEPWYTLDYCASDDQAFLFELLVMLTILLDRYPEDVTEQHLQKDFPRYEFKPIKYDSAWGKLYKMAHGVELPSIQCPVCERFNYEVEAKDCPSCHNTYPMPEPHPLTWTCHLCGDDRPDAQISVCSTDISVEKGLPPGTMRQNVRYCNDRFACVEAAKTKRLSI